MHETSGNSLGLLGLLPGGHVGRSTSHPLSIPKVTIPLMIG